MKTDYRPTILAELPATQRAIVKATGLAQATVSRYLTLLKDESAVHIGAWGNAHRGFMSAIYHPGPGKDVPCPTPLSEAELRRRQSMVDNPLNSRKVVPRFERPGPCELTAAFFGRSA